MADCKIGFIDARVMEAYYELEKGHDDEKQLFILIKQAIENIRKNHMIGIAIPKRLIPREYVRKYGINNLWKYDLPRGWRLLYTVQGSSVSIVSIIIEWMDHKNYERRFKY
jgi:hypothetical protein